MKKADELKKLRRENRALRRRIRDLEQHGAPAAPTEHKNDTAAFDTNNYFSYLLARLRQKSLFARAEKITRYFRSSIWVTRLFRCGMLIYQYLQAGAFVLLYTALFILIIPIMLSLALATLVVTLILRKKNADKLIAACIGRGVDVRFLLLPSKEDFDPEMIRAEAAKTPKASVLVVSPFFFRRRGFGNSEDMYVCCRDEGKNTVILRKYFFFYLRRRSTARAVRVKKFTAASAATPTARGARTSSSPIRRRCSPRASLPPCCRPPPRSTAMRSAFHVWPTSSAAATAV